MTDDLTSVRRAATEEIGECLLSVQSTEKIIHLCVTHVLQLDGAVTAKLLSDAKTQKRTLGQLLSKIREKVEIAENFDETLAEYLDKRNTLAHRLLDVDGGSVSSQTGITIIRVFLASLRSLDNKVQAVFLGLANEWAKARPGYPTVPSEFTNVAPLAIVNSTFFKKQDCRKPSIKPEAVAALKAEGFGATEIAKRLGIGRASVYRFV